jgi:hypothetical protein
MPFAGDWGLVHLLPLVWLQKAKPRRGRGRSGNLMVLGSATVTSSGSVCALAFRAAVAAAWLPLVVSVVVFMVVPFLRRFGRTT